MQESRYLPVNWVDGMKINKTHFIGQENALVYQMAQNTTCILNELNYGLLPVFNGDVGLKLFISTDNQRRLQVRIQKCRAVTAGGYYIEFSEDTLIHGAAYSKLVISEPASLRDLRKKSAEFYVVLSINPYKRVPHGLVDVTEIPPRLPFTIPSFSVDLVPVEEVAKNILGEFQLPVGKMSIEEQRVFLDEEYIPPCASIASHPELLEMYAGLEQFYGKMEIYSVQILQKIIQKKQVNEMAVIVQKLCENFLFVLARDIQELKSTGVVNPPATVVAKISTLARVMKNTMDCYLGSGKEELINYFSDWLNLTQGDLERIMNELSSHQYDHLDINASLDKMVEFTKVISSLFHRLSKVEYIGKRKEAGIFVNEKVVGTGQENLIPKRRSVLGDN